MQLKVLTSGRTYRVRSDTWGGLHVATPARDGEPAVAGTLVQAPRVGGRMLIVTEAPQGSALQRSSRVVRIIDVTADTVEFAPAR